MKGWKRYENGYKNADCPQYSKGMDTTMKRKEQNNSVFARLRRSKHQTLFGMAWFLLLYSLLLYVGSMLFYFSWTMRKGPKWLASVLIVGLIILASSLLSKMFQDWLREKGNNGV
jgi:hypothetical protein